MLSATVAARNEAVDWLIPPGVTPEQLAMLSVIGSGTVAVGSVVASLLIPRITSRWAHRRWLLDRRTECYEEPMEALENANLIYQDGDQGDLPYGEIADRLRALKARVRLYGSAETIALLDDLFMSFNISRSDYVHANGIVDDSVDLHAKKTWLASMKLLRQVQGETRRPIPRVCGKPIDDAPLQELIKDVERVITEMENSAKSRPQVQD